MRDRVDTFHLRPCPTCKWASCLCRFLATHREGCARRTAVLDEHPTPCAAHGTYACETCAPCSCGGAK